jgi:hypothetical protein
MEKRESKIVERNSPASILDPNPRTHRAAQAGVGEINKRSRTWARRFFKLADSRCPSPTAPNLRHPSTHRSPDIFRNPKFFLDTTSFFVYID